MRLIDADALIGRIKSSFHPDERVSIETVTGCFLDETGYAPTIEAEPVRRGHWIRKIWHTRGGYKYFKCDCGEEYTIQKPYDDEIIICSECGKINESVFDSYCPNCGARMDEDELFGKTEQRGDNE